jgi:hypothetical protein
MGANKHIRKVIAGQLKTIERHSKKIEEEIKKASPDFGYIRKWEQEIDTARARVRSDWKVDHGESQSAQRPGRSHAETPHGRVPGNAPRG